MNALHLVWIIPAAVVGGFILGAVLAAGSDNVTMINWSAEDSSADPKAYCAVCPFRAEGGEII